MAGPSAPSVPGTSADFWIMEMASPDLTSVVPWQQAAGMTAQVFRSLGPGNVWGQLFVEVFDPDLGSCRSWFSGVAQPLPNQAWTQITLAWTEDPEFPPNAVVKKLYVVVWGQVGSSYSGSVRVEDVVGLP